MQNYLIPYTIQPWFFFLTWLTVTAALHMEDRVLGSAAVKVHKVILSEITPLMTYTTVFWLQLLYLFTLCLILKVIYYDFENIFKYHKI